MKAVYFRIDGFFYGEEHAMKIKSIQVLRLIASISIILYHSDLFGEHGYLGVDILFVISGFVIMKSTEIGKPHFLLRRLIRIVPFYWMSTVFLYGILYFLPQLSLMNEATVDILLKSLFFVPIKNVGGYGVPLLGAGWTINYEIYFYIVFALCSACSHKYRGQLCSVLICVLSVLSYAIDDALFMGITGSSVLIECVLGIFLYWVYGKIKILDTRLIQWLLILVMILLYGYMWWDGLKSSIEIRSVRMGISAFLFVFLFVVYFMDKKLPDILIKLGDISFSVYIIEYFTTKVFKILVNNVAIVQMRYILLIPLILVTLIIGYLSYEVIEKRLTQWLLSVFIKNSK